MSQMGEPAPPLDHDGFTAPGPGTWTPDPVHAPSPMTRFMQETTLAAFDRGFREMTARYGMLIATLERRVVNSFAYDRVAPVPDDAVPERIATAERVWEDKIWREDLRRWDEETKPEVMRLNRELLTVDPGSLPDEELIGHLERCRDNLAEMVYQHMRHTAAAIVPTGDFVVQAAEWTGLPAAELAQLLAGAAPVSAGESVEHKRFFSALGADPNARELLAADFEPAESVSRLRELPGESGTAAGAYLDLVGYRLVDGFDPGNPCLIELPDVLLESIRLELGRGEAPAVDVSEQTEVVRARVPEDERERFDELLAEARLTYRLRDERGVFTDVWAAGIVRRAGLEAGRRVVERGRIDEPDHFLHAGWDEMQALLLGGGGPAAEELAQRARFRSTYSVDDIPQVLGDPPQPPPDPSGLPPGARRMARAVGFVLHSLFAPSEEPHDAALLRGIAASPGVYEGVARVIFDPLEFDRLEEGDVLVTRTTGEAFNVLLPLLGAIVTDAGGLLSHAAIVAREYGMPGVVGTREATRLIADGSRVRVDGAAGEVSILP